MNPNSPLARPWRWLFSSAEERTPGGIILWWEVRRIPYNLIVGAVGLCSVMLFFLFISISGKLQPGEDAVEPMALIAAPFLINIAYTGGWIAELIVGFLRRDTTHAVGPFLFKLGLTFSLILAALPAGFWGTYLLLLKTGVVR
jgi:hypothetical protein